MTERVVVMHKANVPEINEAMSKAFKENNFRLSLEQLARIEVAGRPLNISILYNNESERYNLPENRIYPIQDDGFIHEETPL